MSLPLSNPYPLRTGALIASRPGQKSSGLLQLGYNLLPTPGSARSQEAPVVSVTAGEPVPLQLKTQLQPCAGARHRWAGLRSTASQLSSPGQRQN